MAKRTRTRSRRKRSSKKGRSKKCPSLTTVNSNIKKLQRSLRTLKRRKYTR